MKEELRHLDRPLDFHWAVTMHRGVHRPRSILDVITGEIDDHDDFTYVLIDDRA